MIELTQQYTGKLLNVCTNGTWAPIQYKDTILPV